MIYFISHIRDTIGNNYLGIDINSTIVEPFLKELKDIIGDDYNDYIQYQVNRDHGNHHMTVINVRDYNDIAKEMGYNNFLKSLDLIFKYAIDDIKMMGVGTAERNGNRTYFIVCKSEKLEAIRKRFNLPEHDFHITLGFKHKDVFGVRKNEVLKKKDKFIKLLKNEYYKNENWNFIKRISNFDLDKDIEIIPVSITERNIKIMCNDYYLVIGYLDDMDKFWVMAKFPVEEELPRLSQNEIAKILN